MLFERPIATADAAAFGDARLAASPTLGLGLGLMARVT